MESQKSKKVESLSCCQSGLGENHVSRAIALDTSVTLDSSRKERETISSRKARPGPLSSIRHAPITRKLRRRPRLTFARNVRPPADRLNIAPTRRTRFSRLHPRGTRSIVHFSRPRGSHVLRAVRLAGEMQKNGGHAPGTPVRTLVLRAISSSPSAISAIANSSIRRPREVELERNPDRSPRELFRLRIQCRRRVRRHPSMSARELRRLYTAAVMKFAGNTESKSIRVELQIYTGESIVRCAHS